MFYSSFRPDLRFPAVAEVGHEARVMHGQAAELGRGHPRLAEEFLDFADQHGPSLRYAVESNRRVKILAREILLV